MIKEKRKLEEMLNKKIKELERKDNNKELEKFNA